MCRVRLALRALGIVVVLIGNLAAQNAIVTPAAAPAAVSIDTRESHLRIGSGDLLEMTVFDEPEMTQGIRVSDSGEGNISLIGAVKLSGLTTAQAETMIATRFRDGNFLLDPQVHIFIREYGTQGVSVLGEVRRPGVYGVLGRRTLLDIISQAGGLTPMAGTQVTVQRADDQRNTLTADISNDAAKSLANDVELHPGDKVIVPRAGIVYVIGDVGRPGGYLMQNNGNITLVQAVALAAGATRTASAKHTRILHKAPTGITETVVDLKKILAGKSADIQLQAEDVVFVPTSGTKSILQRAPSIMQTAASAIVYSATDQAMN